VAGQTLARAREIGLDVHRLPAWYDVDESMRSSVSTPSCARMWKHAGESHSVRVSPRTLPN
jgi:hypothetical protein